MIRVTLTKAALAAILLAQGGCLEFLRGNNTAFSPANADSYPAPALGESANLDRLAEYTSRLKQIVDHTPPTTQPVAAPVKIAPVALMPLEDAGPRRGANNPFDPTIPLRPVDMPGRTAVAAATGEQPRIRVIEQPASPALPSGEASKTPAPARKGAEPPGIDQLIEYYEAAAMEHPEDLQTQLNLRLIYLATRQDDKALRGIPTASPEQNAAIAAILRPMMSIRDGNGTNMTSAEASNAVLGLQMLREKLMSQADLQIPVVRLCQSVDGFGAYKAFQGTEFIAGRGST